MRTERRRAAQPLVSCLMPTLAVSSRFDGLIASMRDYCRQTYPNRELVVLVHRSGQTRDAIAGHVAALRRDDIRLIDLDEEPPLGQKRNLSIESACGEVICQWDDDDRHHRDRIAKQVDALIQTRSRAVLLQDVIQYFPHHRRLYWTNWQATEARSLPGSLVCWRDEDIAYPADGPASRLGEDSVVCRQLLARGNVHMLAGEPHLYIYVSHGRNSWPDDHHVMLANRLSLSRGLLLRRETALRAGLADFEFGPEEVVFHGGNGLAFSLRSR